MFKNESIYNNNDEISDEEENKSSSGYSGDELYKKSENQNSLDEPARNS